MTLLVTPKINFYSLLSDVADFLGIADFDNTDDADDAYELSKRCFAAMDELDGFPNPHQAVGDEPV